MQSWDKAVDWIKGKISDQTFDTWFRPITFRTLSEEKLVLQVPNKFFKEWLSTNYLDLITDAISGETGKKTAVILTVSNILKPIPDLSTGSDIYDEKLMLPKCKFNKKYSFENFVVGSSNQLPHAASVAVTEMLGSKYNPLFIYGGVGLGKTHLVHAIGMEVYKKNLRTRICYISCEQFMNEFISCLRNDKMEHFHKRFRKEVDILLMDDIQFLAGKDATQEEFFHIFNSLYEENKQIVLTSDSYPKEIPNMEERLRSRFQWGLIADIQPPEFETRLAIVEKKAKNEGIHLDNDAAVFLAKYIKSNVRELEGSLINLAAHASLENKRIDIDFAKHTLEKIIAMHHNRLTVESVQKTVCNHFNISVTELKGKKRKRSISFPRQVAMYICRKNLDKSFPELGEQFGGKDHTTVLAACKKIEFLVNKDMTVRGNIEAIERLLGI